MRGLKVCIFTLKRFRGLGWGSGLSVWDFGLKAGDVVEPLERRAWVSGSLQSKWGLMNSGVSCAFCFRMVGAENAKY